MNNHYKIPVQVQLDISHGLTVMCDDFLKRYGTKPTITQIKVWTKVLMNSYQYKYVIENTTRVIKR